MSANNTESKEFNQEDQEKKPENNNSSYISRSPHDKENPYVIINKNIYSHKNNLSWEAKGMISFLLSLKNDFKINKKYLWKNFNGGKEKVARILDELIETRYLEKVPLNTFPQKFAYYIHEMPQVTYNQSESRKPDGCKPATIKYYKDINIKESKPKKKKETVAKAPLASDDAHFVSNLLYEKLIQKNPKYKKPDLNKWAKDIQITINQDKRTKEDLVTVINWAFAHKGDYWPIAIQSARTLRKMFDRAWSEITHLSQKEKTNSIFEKQTSEMNLRWLKNKIEDLTRLQTRGNLGYNNTHAYDTILKFQTPLSSPKMIDIVKSWDQFRRR